MRVETKVGILFISALLMVVIFAYYLGLISPFSSTHDLYVTYNFAGGIEVGSPVRVMGIKVGKVKSIEFEPDLIDEAGNEVKLKLKISISKRAWKTIRKDSRYFINLAGVIGEKFLEVTPGSTKHPVLEPGSIVRGEDPPRIDQLISQGYGLAGKVLDFVERNEGTVIGLIDKTNLLVENVNKLSTNFNKTMILINKAEKNEDMIRLLKNTIKISDNLTLLTEGLTTKKAKETYDLLYRLVWRLEKLDEKAIRQFLQKEGIRARMF